MLIFFRFSYTVTIKALSAFVKICHVSLCPNGFKIKTRRNICKRRKLSQFIVAKTLSKLIEDSSD
jgi:hypothetical protein